MAAHRNTGTPTHHNQARGQSNARKHTATKQQLLPYPGAHASCLLLLASTTLKTRLVHELSAGWAAVDGPAQIEPHPSMRPHTYTLHSFAYLLQMYDTLGSPRTRIFALPKSQSFSTCVCRRAKPQPHSKGRGERRCEGVRGGEERCG